MRADAAVTINGLVRWTIKHGCAGLEAWAGTPGTVGGAIFGNAHFGGRLIGELVDRGAARDARTARPWIVPAAEMAFGYDRSRLQTTGEVLLSAVFRVSAGDPAALRATARDVAGVPQADAAARHAERRLRVSESRARAATSCRTAFRGRPARWSIAPA